MDWVGNERVKSGTSFAGWPAQRAQANANHIAVFIGIAMDLFCVSKLFYLP
jgi:hypothetical protein